MAFKLKAEKRTLKGKKVKQLRNQKLVPASLYGHEVEPTKIQVNYRELERTLRDAGGTNVIEVEVDGETYSTIVTEVQRDVLRGDILHVDFRAPDMTKRIVAEVPIFYDGQSPLVTSRKGILITGPNNLTVEMLPSRMINQVRIDIGQLTEIGATISVKDLDLADIRVLNDPEEMIARIVQPSAARALERLEAAEAAAAEGGSAENSEADFEG